MRKYFLFFSFFIVGQALVLPLGAPAQDKSVINDYLIRWVRHYWTCSTTCPAIRTKIQDLINKGADPNAESSEHKTALIYAIESGSHNTKENLALVSLLLNNGADPNVKGPDGKTPLMLVPWFRNNSGEVAAEITQQLIDHKADVNAIDAQGESALSIMIKSQEIKSIQILLDHGADTSIKNEQGISLLDSAIVNENKDIQDLLLRNKKSMDQGSIWMAVHAKNAEVLKTILNGGDVNALRPLRGSYDTGIGGRDTLLIAAVNNNDIESVKVLLDHGAEIDKRGYMDKTAFLVSVEDGYLDIADLLVYRGVDLADNSKGNWKGLAIAAKRGYTTIVKKMIDKGTPVDTRGDAISESSATPLMLAAQAGHLDIVQFLVDHGADLKATSRNFEGNDFANVFIGTPLDWAQKGGHQDVINYLISKGAKSASQ